VIHRYGDPTFGMLRRPMLNACSAPCTGYGKAAVCRRQRRRRKGLPERAGVELISHKRLGSDGFLSG